MSRRLLSFVLTGILAVGAVLAPAAGAAAAPPGREGHVVGKVAPNLTMIRPTGKPVKLSDYRGQYVVLDLSTMWCTPSQFAAEAARDAADRFNAPGALDKPLVWITAQLDGFVEGVAPTPGQLVRFGLEHDLGDRRTPVVSFGADDSATLAAAEHQLLQYVTENSDNTSAAVPTYVVLDPKGVIVHVGVGFISDESADAEHPSTVQSIAEAIGAKDVPYTPTPAPYQPAALGSVDATLTVDGLSGSATVNGTNGGSALDPFGSTGLGGTAYARSAPDLGADVVGVGVQEIGGDGLLDPASTYSLSLSSPVWSSTGPFRSLSLVPDDLVLKLAVAPADLSDGDIVPTTIPVTAAGTVAPFLMQDALDSAAEEIADRGWGDDVVVWGFGIESRWDGAPVASYGR